MNQVIQELVQSLPVGHVVTFLLVVVAGLAAFAYVVAYGHRAPRPSKAIESHLLILFATAYLGLLSAFLGFGFVVPWCFHVVGTEEALTRFPGLVDPAWPAVTIARGRPNVWPYGTISANPVLFTGALASLIGGLVVFFCATSRFRAAQRSTGS